VGLPGGGAELHERVSRWVCGGVGGGGGWSEIRPP
jgi:hypothetical protein